MQYLLLKMSHLVFLCIKDLPKTYLNKLNILIKSDNLLEHYFIKFINRDLYLWLISHICEGVDQYGRCSMNSACGCFHRANADDISICGFLWPTCSQVALCNSSNNTCDQSDTICVGHPRCHNRPVCYPVSMIDEPVCPTIA
ncbi:unnamed protein product, partial [Adineta steineri]